MDRSLAANRPSDHPVTLAPSKSRMAAEKRCSTCQQVRPSADFWRSLGSADLLSVNCKTCTVVNGQRDRAEREARQAETVGKKSKQCGFCKSTKPLTAFAKIASAKDGMRKTCAPCVSTQGVKRRNRPAER